MLFYYFKSKEELFNYLVNYSIDYTVDNFLNKIDKDETDFIEKNRQISKLKFKFYMEEPHLSLFFVNIYLNEYERLPDKIKKRLIEIRDAGLNTMFNNIDKGLFRDDVEADMIIKLISLTMSGYETAVTNQLKGKDLSSIAFKPYWDEFENLLDASRKIYYK